MENIIKIINQTNPDKVVEFTPQEHIEYLEGMLLHVCHDLENCVGAVSTFELPVYLENYWRQHKDRYYAQQLLYQKKEKYLKMKKELEDLAKELDIK